MADISKQSEQPMAEKSVNEKDRASFLDWLHMIRFSHTLFALPFAGVGFAMGCFEVGGFSWRQLVLVLLCMVFARSAAMAYNRIIDAKIDAKNPRTKQREIPSGVITKRAAWVFLAICATFFLLCAAMLNWLTLVLAPLALGVIFLYSHLKRWTSLSHFGIGVALSLAPVGSYLAITGYFSWPPIALGMGVMLWVAGFDIIYSLQDVEFDREMGLYSLPSRYSPRLALWVAYFCSLLSPFAIGYALFCYAPTLLSTVAMGLFFGIVLVQLLSVKLHDLSNINARYMLLNGIASLIFGVLAILSIILQFRAHTY